MKVHEWLLWEKKTTTKKTAFGTLSDFSTMSGTLYQTGRSELETRISQK